jgi:hypothetical protein
MIDDDGQLINSDEHKDSTSNLYKHVFIRNFIKFISEIIKKIFDDKSIISILEKSKIINKILVGLSLVIIYAFYNLGYTFLYGYYFGGSLNENIPLIDMFINPVPINFKSIISVGVSFLIYILITFFPLGKVILVNKWSEKLFYFFMFIIGNSLYIIGCGFVFNGNFDYKVFLNMIYFIAMIIIMPLSIFSILVFIMYSNRYKFKFYICFSYNMLFTIVALELIKMICPITNIYLQVLFLYNIYFGTIFTTIIFRFIWIKINKYLVIKLNRFILKVIVIFPIDIMMSIIIKVHMKKTYLSFEFSMILIGSTILLIVLANIVDIILKKLDLKEPETIIIKTDIGGDTYKKIKISKSMVIFIIIFMAFTLPFIPHITAEAGKTTRYTIMGLSKDKIIYEKADDKKDFKYIFGNIVAQQDNTYFISKLPERKLMTIKNTNVVSIPCDKFKIGNNLEKLYNKEIGINDKYNFFNSNEQLKIVDSPKQLENIDGKFNYSKDIFIQENSEINKDNYNFGISISIEYKIDKDDNIKEFIIKFGHKFPQNINSINDQNLKEQMEKLLSDYESVIIGYFNLPILDEDNNIFYYSNGELGFTENLNSDFNNRREEEYEFVSSLN